MAKPPMYAGYRTIATCLWCGQELVDGRVEAGSAGVGPLYMTRDGDYGCGDSPDTTQDGCGRHTSDVMTTGDGHAVKVSLDQVVQHDHPALG